MALPEVLLVYKKSKLALYVHENKHPRYQKLVADGGAGGMGASLEAAHVAHAQTLDVVKRVLAEAGLKVRVNYRARVTREATVGRLVVTVGGDGTVLDASHKIAWERGQGSTLLGVNSDPDRSVGFLCAANEDNFKEMLQLVLDGELAPTPLPRIRGDIDGEPLPFPVLNEALFAHNNPAGTSRYGVCVADENGNFGEEEMHKSSGLWLAGPVGSTAAIASAGGTIVDLDDNRLQLVVREAYVTDPAMRPKLNHLLLKDRKLRVRSRIREGRLYLDGPHKIVPVPVGALLTLDMNAPPLPLVVTPALIARREKMKFGRASTPSHKETVTTTPPPTSPGPHDRTKNS